MYCNKRKSGLEVLIGLITLGLIILAAASILFVLFDKKKKKEEKELEDYLEAEIV